MEEMDKKAKAKKLIEDIANRKDEEQFQLIFNNYVLENIASKSLAVCQSGAKLLNSPGWVSGPAIYDHYILHYIIDGKGVYFVNGHVYPLVQGDIFLIRPYMEISYQADYAEPYHYYWVGFQGTDCQELLIQAGFSDTDWVIHCKQLEKTQHYMQSISAIRSWSHSQQYMLLGYLYQLFSVLIDDSDRLNTYNQRYYHDAVTFIKQNASLPSLKVNDIANVIGIDRTHLYRIFQEHGKLSVKEFINKVRMDKAKLFLLNTDNSIELIADYCGFSSASHFIQTFKKVEKCTPAAFRNHRSSNVAQSMTDKSDG